MVQRFALLAGGVAAVGLLLAATHASGAPDPGRSIVWSTPAATPGSGPAAAAIPSATPGPRNAGGPLAPLSGALSGVLRGLDDEARRTAQGQYSILQEISTTLRGWIEHLLSRAAARG